MTVITAVSLFSVIQHGFFFGLVASGTLNSFLPALISDNNLKSQEKPHQDAACPYSGCIIQSVWISVSFSSLENRTAELLLLNLNTHTHTPSHIQIANPD